MRMNAYYYQRGQENLDVAKALPLEGFVVATTGRSHRGTAWLFKDGFYSGDCGMHCGTIFPTEEAAKLKQATIQHPVARGRTEIRPAADVIKEFIKDEERILNPPVNKIKKLWERLTWVFR